jgi:hypothetical protein
VLRLGLRPGGTDNGQGMHTSAEDPNFTHNDLWACPQDGRADDG